MENSQSGASDGLKPVTLADVWSLGRTGHLGADRWAQAHALVRNRGQWRQYLERTLLGLGVIHILAGVVFFFAFNWDYMASLHKFALVFTLLGLSFAAWWGFGPDSLRGQAAGTATTMTLGILMALFGQIYQTGADSWELFFGWAALSLPWMLLSRSPAHVLLWSLVALTAMHTYLDQVSVPFGQLNGKWVSFIGGAAMAAILLVLHLLGARAQSVRTWWLEGTLQLCAILHFAIATWMGAAALGFDENPDPTNFFLGMAFLGLFLWLAIYRVGSSFAAVLSFAGITSALTIYPIAATVGLYEDLGFLTLLLCGVIGFAGTAGFVLAVRPLLALVKERAQ